MWLYGFDHKNDWSRVVMYTLFRALLIIKFVM
jgi:hypothetical protein